MPGQSRRQMMVVSVQIDAVLAVVLVLLMAGCAGEADYDSEEDWEFQAEEVEPDPEPPPAPSEPGSAGPGAVLPPPQPPPPDENPSPPSTSVDLVEDVIGDLQWGNIVYDPPSEMTVGQSRTIELLLSPSATVEELQAEIGQTSGVQADRIRLSNRMEALLSGPGFSIESLTPDEQAVGREATTRWAWNVTATDDGHRTLHLVLSAYIDVAGRDAPLVVRTFDRDIEVRITLGQQLSGFVAGNWKWLWAAILVPLATFIWRRRQREQGQARGVPER